MARMWLTAEDYSAAQREIGIIEEHVSVLLRIMDGKVSPALVIAARELIKLAKFRIEFEYGPTKEAKHDETEALNRAPQQQNALRDNLTR